MKSLIKVHTHTHITRALSLSLSSHTHTYIYCELQLTLLYTIQMFAGSRPLTKKSKGGQRARILSINSMISDRFQPLQRRTCSGPLIFGVSRVIPRCKMHDTCNILRWSNTYLFFFYISRTRILVLGLLFLLLYPLFSFSLLLKSWWNER